MFFLIPKNVTSERPIALVPTLIRWWEALRAPEVAKWQQRNRIESDVTDGRNGGALRTEWEMKRYKYRAGKEDQGAEAPVLDLAKAFERVQSPCGEGLGNALQLPKDDLASAVRVLRAPEASAVRRRCGGAAPDHHGHLARVQVELLASAHCAAGCVK